MKTCYSLIIFTRGEKVANLQSISKQLENISFLEIINSLQEACYAEKIKKNSNFFLFFHQKNLITEIA